MITLYHIRYYPEGTAGVAMKAELTVEHGRAHIWVAVDIDTPARRLRRRGSAVLAAITVTVLGFAVGVNVLDAPAPTGPVTIHTTP